MEVDHFDPTRKKDIVQQYENLFLSTRHCNGSKGDYWPTKADQKMGIRFLNPCKEIDYGVHIFEDPATHHLVGVTPPGRFHIRKLDLNAPHLVAERKERADIIRVLASAVTLKPHVMHSELIDAKRALQHQLDEMIPTIPPPPAS